MFLKIIVLFLICSNVDCNPDNTTNSCADCQLKFINCFNETITTYSFCQCILGCMICNEVNYCNDSSWNQALISKYNWYSCENATNSDIPPVNIKLKLEKLQIAILAALSLLIVCFCCVIVASCYAVRKKNKKNSYMIINDS